jgi:hypothetical protein
MKLWRSIPPVVLTAFIAHPAAAPSAPPAAQTGELPSGPATNHAVGYYDASIGRPVLIGGPAPVDSTTRDSVWSWSGSDWELMTQHGPPSRTNASGAYDGRRRRGIVAGGAHRPPSGSTWQIAADTWEGDRVWRRIGDIDARDHHSMVTDGLGTVLLFGGIPANRSAPWPADTWRLDDRGWVRIAADGPAGRGRSALAYDSKRGQVVLFGGVSAPTGPAASQTFLADTWVFEHGRWRQAADGGPRGRYAHAMVFDERAGLVLMYGGSSAHRNGALTDMWKWDGREWTEIRLTGATPGYRYQPVMIYDRARGTTILYGGLDGPKHDTWEWNGERWRQVGR